VYRPILSSIVRASLAGLFAAALLHCSGAEQDIELSGEESTEADQSLGALSASQTVGPQADPTCETGIQAGSACCPAACGECGGEGCSQRPGGTANCCSGAINDSGVLCSGSAPPCIVVQPQVVPPPQAVPTTDPTCETGILRNGACCEASCGECGGVGCSQRPGGTDSCCTGAINASNVFCTGATPPCIVTQLTPNADPLCETGILSGTACCPAICGGCGGAGCSNLPGGAANCCTGAINDSGVLCSGSLPPCIVQ
jgi:hypothetical protein